MPITVREDENERGGFALIDLGRKLNIESIRLSFRRLDAEPRNLGPEGWQAEAAYFEAEQVANSGQTTVVRVGPSVVNEIDELIRIQISIEPGEPLGVVQWPYITKSAENSAGLLVKRQNTVPISGLASPAAARSREETKIEAAPLSVELPSRSSEPSQPSQEEDQRPSVPPPASGTKEPLKDTVDSPQAKAGEGGRKRWAVLSILLIGLFSIMVAIWAFSGQPDSANNLEFNGELKVALSDAGPDGDVKIFGDEGGPFSPSVVDVQLSASWGKVLWEVVGPTPAWIRLSQSEGMISINRTSNVSLQITDDAKTLAVGEHVEHISFRNRVSGAVVRKTVRVSVQNKHGVLALDGMPDVNFSGPKGGPFTPTTAQITLKATGGSLRWRLDKAPDWLDVDKISGQLNNDGTQTLNVTLLAASTGKPVGVHRADLVLVNSGTGSALPITATLTVTQPPPPPKREEPGRLEIGNRSTIMFIGKQGGPFDPATAAAKLIAKGKGFPWRIEGGRFDWFDVSKWSGHLNDDGAYDLVINANQKAREKPPGTHRSKVTVVNEATNTRTEIGVTLVVDHPVGELKIDGAPLLRFVGSKKEGFSPRTAVLRMLSGKGFRWWVDGAIPDWLTLSELGGELSENSTKTLMIGPNAKAGTYPTGEHFDKITFVNLDTGARTVQRVSLSVDAPPSPEIGELKIDGPSLLRFVGSKQDGFSPRTAILRMVSVGSGFRWRADYPIPDWLTLGERGGHLSENSTNTLMISPNAKAGTYPPGEHSDKITFVNLDTGAKTVQHVSLSVDGPPPPPLETEKRPPLELLGTRRLIEFNGPTRGPFAPQSATILVRANGSAAEWKLEDALPSWISVEPREGRISAGTVAEIKLTLRPSASSAGPGVYPGLIAIKNKGLTDWITQPIRLVVSDRQGENDPIQRDERSIKTKNASLEQGNKISGFIFTNFEHEVYARRGFQISEKSCATANVGSVLLEQDISQIKYFELLKLASSRC